MKRIFIICFFITILAECYSQNIIFSADTFLMARNPQKNIREIPYFDENKEYDFTIDFVSRIKHSYYIGAHTMIADTNAYIKLLSPKTKAFQGYKIIKPGRTYPMQVKLLYPYPLLHSLDWYTNYNFLFKNEVVSLQATDCMKYIFISDNLKGLRHIQSKDIDTLPRFIQFMNMDSLANNIILSILKKDSIGLNTYIDTSSVINCLEKFLWSFSSINVKRIRCLPPYKIKYKDTYKYSFRKTSIKKLSSMSDILMNYTNYIVDDISSVNFIETKMIFKEYPYITYRVTWTSSQSSGNMVTYMSLKCNECKFSLISISSHRDYH